eukprot:Clim_evm24s251 gene=Clim_evmTU24s251
MAGRLRWNRLLAIFAILALSFTLGTHASNSTDNSTDDDDGDIDLEGPSIDDVDELFSMYIDSEVIMTLASSTETSALVTYLNREDVVSSIRTATSAGFRMISSSEELCGFAVVPGSIAVMADAAQDTDLHILIYDEMLKEVCDKEHTLAAVTKAYNEGFYNVAFSDQDISVLAIDNAEISNEEDDQSSGNSTEEWLIPVLGVVGGLALVTTVVFAVLFIRKRKQGTDSKNQTDADLIQRSMASQGYFNNVTDGYDSAWMGSGLESSGSPGRRKLRTSKESQPSTSSIRNLDIDATADMYDSANRINRASPYAIDESHVYQDAQRSNDVYENASLGSDADSIV